MNLSEILKDANYKLTPFAPEQIVQLGSIIELKETVEITIEESEAMGLAFIKKETA